MSNDEHALLAAIAAAPADDTPRLVYADWLDDHGRAVRAEFIRLQCRIAQIETQPRHVVNLFSGLWQRQQEILDDPPPDLFGPLSDMPPSVRMVSERGFVSEVTLHVLVFLTYADRLAAAVPPPRVEVTNAAADAVAFLATPHLGCVTAVRVYDDLLTPFEPFEQWPVTDAAARLVRLDTLDLEGCGLGDAEVAFLANLPLHALADVDLSNNALTDAVVPLILDTALPRQLKRLVLGGNPIGDQGAIELADRWPRTSPLESLNLRFTNIGRDGQAALLARFGGKVDLF